MTAGNRDSWSVSSWHITTGDQDPDTVNRLLRSLPGWFGIESSVAHYVAKAHELPTYLALPATESPGRVAERQPVGVLLAARHFRDSAEIYLMAVKPSLHRRGIGRALVEELETDLIADSAHLLQVKTLGPSQPDAGYDQTRKFYARTGFRPLEEIHGLWPGNPCLLMVKVLEPAT